MLARPFVKTAALATALALPLALAVSVPAAAATVTVSNWNDLKAAFAVDGDTIVLGAHISIDNGDSLAVDAGEATTLDLNGHTLSITNVASSHPAIGVRSTSTLTVNATDGGALIASGGTMSAGIGGSHNTAGTIIINGGTITATGGSTAAGIGGGTGGYGSTTVINGGTITATGGLLGAGIGGGVEGGGGTITINGGTITAQGGEGAAGIGGGAFSGDGGLTTITGGTTTATGGAAAAGIGGGDGGNSGTLDIHGIPNAGAALDGGGPNAAPVTNSVAPSGIGYSAAASLVGEGGKIIVGFNYLVSFDAAGGTGTPPATVVAGDTIAAPTSPTRDGYEFAGWSVNGSIYNFTTPVTKPITLTATWTAIPVTHLVTFDADGGTEIAPMSVTDGDTIAAPTNPTRDGYTFSGWVSNGTAYDFTTAITEPITLTAIWAVVVATPAEPTVITAPAEAAVVAAPAEAAVVAASAELASTGTNPTPGLGVAGLLLLAGFALIGLRRRISAR